MHLSTHNWMRAEPLEVTLRRIQRLGYSSIELSGEPTQYDVATTRSLLKQHGIKCWGSVTLTLGERNLAARDAGQRARTRSQFNPSASKHEPHDTYYCHP
jgi:sugar phosphate isomerase/epimerase